MNEVPDDAKYRQARGKTRGRTCYHRWTKNDVCAQPGCGKTRGEVDDPDGGNNSRHTSLPENVRIMRG
jgi:hypothetical protein